MSSKSGKRIKIRDDEREQASMPTKHIDDRTWRKIEQETVKAVLATREPLKDTEVLKLLILKGLETITEDDYRKLKDDRKRE